MPTDPRLTLLLSIADDELVIGHRHSEWTGWAPYIEEDLAFSSIAQDEIAHARLLYELAEPLAGRDPDRLALGRDRDEYLNAVVCERPNGDWGYTIARQYVYDTADDVRLAALEGSSFAELSGAVRTIRLEERYHLDHARMWFERLAGGPVQARERFAAGLSKAIREGMGLFEALPGEEDLVSDGTLPRPNRELLAEWLGRIGADLESASLDWVFTEHDEVGELVPTSSGEAEGDHTLAVPGIDRSDGHWVHVGEFAGVGGRHGRHSEDFTELWEELTGLYRAVPGATW